MDKKVEKTASKSETKRLAVQKPAVKKPVKKAEPKKAAVKKVAKKAPVKKVEKSADEVAFEKYLAKNDPKGSIIKALGRPKALALFVAGVKRGANGFGSTGAK